MRPLRSSGSERALEVDHIKSRKHASTDDPENLQALCWRCNLGKEPTIAMISEKIRAAIENT